MRLALVILEKELRELLAQRALIGSLLVSPALFVLMPLLLMRETGSAREQVAIGQQFSLMLLMLPQLLPAVLAAQSVVGEKVRRTLEPLLATPISTRALLAGKILGATVPALVVTWAAAAVFAVGVRAEAVDPSVAREVLNLRWIAAILVSSPLLAVIAVALAILISARVSDPRSAQQLSALLVLPLVGALAAQALGLLGRGAAHAIALDLVLAVLAVAATALAVRGFDRESILTRWR